jgi:hypothetical protein
VGDPQPAEVFGQLRHQLWMGVNNRLVRKGLAGLQPFQAVVNNFLYLAVLFGIFGRVRDRSVLNRLLIE